MRMTVRHVEPNGDEHVFQVESVDRIEGRLVFTTVRQIATGKVYIMNEAGKTVSMYDFDKNQPKKEQTNG